MPRTKYKISANDFLHARRYIESQLQTLGLELRDEVTHSDAFRSLTALLDASTKARRPDRLTEWCEDNLTTASWSKLKISIRKRRQRHAHPDEHRTVTLTKRAHELLTKAAERQGVTMSDVVEKSVRARGRE